MVLSDKKSLFDGEECVKICVGYAKGELLPPYDLEKISPEKAEEIRNYADETQAMKRSISFVTYSPLAYYLEDHGSVVEIFGCWADLCVSTALKACVHHNIPVRVNTDKLIWSKEYSYYEQLNLLTSCAELYGHFITVYNGHIDIVPV
ncbi:MAG: hypothetical protein U9P44_01665 [archaeon]|nr:hypothetical protein [archaeon]